MNNLQRVEKFCKDYSTASGMSLLYSTIHIIGQDKDMGALSLLLQKSSSNPRLADIVLDNTLISSAVNNQWHEAWDDLINAFVVYAPKKIADVLRLSTPNTQMKQRALDAIWNTISKHESAISSQSSQSLKSQQSLLSELALGAVHTNDCELYDQCLQRWRQFDKMYSPLQDTWDKQVEMAAYSGRNWVLDRITTCTDKSDLLLSYIKKSLPLGVADEITPVISKFIKTYSNRVLPSHVIDYIVENKKLWTGENLRLIQNIHAAGQNIKKQHTLSSTVLTPALYAHAHDDFLFEDVQRLCDAVGQSKTNNMSLQPLAELSVQLNDFRVLQYLSECYPDKYQTAFSDAMQSVFFIGFLEVLLFKVDHATDLLISKSPMIDGEEITAFRQKLNLIEAVDQPPPQANKRKI